MKMEETKELLKNKFLFRIFVIEIALLCVINSYLLLAWDGAVCKTMKDLLLGIAGSALVWSFIELFDFIVNTFEAYKNQRDKFIAQGQDFCVDLCNLLKNKEIKSLDYEKVCVLVSNFHQVVAQAPFYEPIYTISDEFIELYNYINRLDWKLAGLKYCIDKTRDVEIKIAAIQKIYDALVEISTFSQDFDKFVQENNNIDNEYERLSEIEVNCEPLPMPSCIVSSGADGNLGASVKFVDFQPGITKLRTLRISKQFDKIAEHTPSTFIVYSLVFGKLKAYK